MIYHSSDFQLFWYIFKKKNLREVAQTKIPNLWHRWHYIKFVLDWPQNLLESKHKTMLKITLTCVLRYYLVFWKWVQLSYDTPLKKVVQIFRNNWKYLTWILCLNSRTVHCGFQNSWDFIILLVWNFMIWNSRHQVNFIKLTF